MMTVFSLFSLNLSFKSCTGVQDPTGKEQCPVYNTETM